MNNTKICTICPQIRFNLCNMIAAVQKRIAAFFYSTQLQIIHDKATKNKNVIKDLGAAQLQRLRLFFVAKGRYIVFYSSRAPPFDIEIH